jgi:hypothetical protein
MLFFGLSVVGDFNVDSIEVGGGCRLTGGKFGSIDWLIHDDGDFPGDLTEACEGSSETLSDRALLTSPVGKIFAAFAVFTVVGLLAKMESIVGFGMDETGRMFGLAFAMSFSL